MASTASTLGQELRAWFGRAVVVARGADDVRDGAERALAAGDPTAALGLARELLERVPGSPVGLLLAADAAEAAWLDEFAARYLAELAERVPWQPEVWLRLGLARLRVQGDAPEAREALGRAAAADDTPLVRGWAVAALADLDLAQGDPARAAAWLARVPPEQTTPELEARRALAALELGDVEGAREAAKALPPAATLDGAGALLAGRLLSAAGGDATEALLRAYILEAPGAARALALSASSLPPAGRARVARVLRASDDETALVRAALAIADGDRGAARAALAAAAGQGDVDAARTLLTLATQDGDGAGLRRAVEALEGPGAPAAERRGPGAPAAERSGQGAPAAERAIARALEALEGGAPGEALDALDGAAEHPWAVELRRQIVGRWAPPDAPLALPEVLGELRRAARALEDTAALVAAEALAVEGERPLRVAIVGEFNAGKSTFLNALLGAELAPMGVVPVTACPHHVVYSPDPFARVVTSTGHDRVVAPERLKATLDEVRRAGARALRVTVGQPLERLRHFELLDTPGFNAPDAEHAAAARSVLAEAHVALWLLDATQPLKESERRVLGELAKGKLPVQALVNKIDRLEPGALPRVEAYVASALAEVGLASLVPPVAFSARRALDARVGRGDELAGSRWAEVEALVERLLVGAAPGLKDRALGRRAASMLEPLLALAESLATVELRALRAEAAAGAAWHEAALALERRAGAAPKPFERALDEPRRRLRDDLAPLVEGAGAGAVRAYAVGRVVQRLAAPLAEGLVASLPSLAPLQRDALAALGPAVSAALHGLVQGLAQPSAVLEVPLSLLYDTVRTPAARALRAGPPGKAGKPVGAPLVSRLKPLYEALGARAPRLSAGGLAPGEGESLR
ncbi:MAG TPA: dynamin family protein [Polyangiaceae bacterium]|nr:dynamin family protein [Polyangiaceae bacterium]